jgi:integrase
MAAKLTDVLIRRLPVPEKGNKIHYDSDAKGFGARVTAAGARSFILNYVTRAGRERRYTIGACGDWSTTDARAEAKRLRQLIDQGGDPLADLETERQAPTTADLCDRFETEHLPRKRLGTARDYRSIIRNHIRPHFGAHSKVADVTFADIDSLHRKITKAGSTYAANRCVAVLSKMFALAIRWNMRPDNTNPCKSVEKNTEYRRKRYLSADELARLSAALVEHPDKQIADIVRVLLLTGCRGGEALSMRWAHIDLTAGVWSKPAASTKQKEDHVVPLSAPVRLLLSEIHAEQIKCRALGEFVFSGIGSTGHVVEIKKSWDSICRTARIANLRIHDLRHSFASQLASGGASLPLIGQLLGHSNPSTTSRYAHLFDDPQRAAVERVGATIAAADRPAAEQPAPFKRSR